MQAHSIKDTSVGVQERGVDIAMRLAANGMTLRSSDFSDAGVHRQSVANLVESGRLEQISRGCYRIAPNGSTDVPATWKPLLAAAARWPTAIVCGPTAAAWHGLAPDEPWALWLAVRRGRSRPHGMAMYRQVVVREWNARHFAAARSSVMLGNESVPMVSPEHVVAEIAGRVLQGYAAAGEKAAAAAEKFLASGGSRQMLREALTCVMGRVWLDAPVALVVGEA